MERRPHLIRLVRQVEFYLLCLHLAPSERAEVTAYLFGLLNTQARIWAFPCPVVIGAN